MADIDFGQLSEALNDKSDRDLRNVDTTAKADAVIDYQEPTADNGYTWYRKYKSGWVEQGGIIRGTGTTSVTLPIVMKDSLYTLNTTAQDTDTNTSVGAASWYNMQSTGFSLVSVYWTSSNPLYISWQVSGMAAN